MRVVPLLLVVVTACVSAADTDPEVREFSSAKKSGGGGNVIDHSGDVLAASTTYAIYWGPSADFPSDLESGMASLLGGFTNSSYLGIAQQYMRGAAITTTYGGSVSDTSTPPKSALNTASVAAEACKFFPNPDPNALYIVFTSNAPHVSFCAWHNKATCNGVEIQVAYVPNQADLPGCSPYTVSNLGCNSLSVGTVATADSVAHEFMETITDAHIDAWYDSSHGEVGDKCNFNYQSCVSLGNNTSWQIQSIWSNAISGCQQ